MQLSSLHGESAGQWFLEAGFGRVDATKPPTFANLDEARAWIGQQLGDPDRTRR